MLSLLSGNPFRLGNRASLGMLMFRIVVGSAFVLHGLPKIQSAMTWMNGMGMGDVPGILQALAAVSEFGGGIALILGLLTPLASLGIIATMVGAMAMVHIPMGHPFISMSGSSYELALVYMMSGFLTFMAGPGQYSLDAMFSKHETYTESASAI